MTTTVDAREAIYQRFVDNTALATTNYTFDSEQYTPPAGETWVRLMVRHTDSEQHSLGGTNQRKFRRFGLIFVQVFSPLDAGTRANDTVVQATRDIFEGVDASGIKYYNAIPREIGPDGAWFQTNLEITFDYDETK